VGEYRDAQLLDSLNSNLPFTTWSSVNPTAKPTPVMKLTTTQDRNANFKELKKNTKQREENNHRARAKFGIMYGKSATGSTKTSYKPNPKAMGKK